METTASPFQSVLDSAEAYGKTTFELSKLKALQGATNIAASVVSSLGIVLLILLFAIALNIGIAMLLGELLGKPYYGFFIVAAFYLVAGVMSHFFLHKLIKKPLTGLIIRRALQ